MEQSIAKTHSNSVSGLMPVEAEVVQLFIQFSRALGQPRSYAEIYGLLFISPVPLTLNQLEARLQISQGSTSQGLHFLMELGAVRTVKFASSRRTHYEAVAELRKMAGCFVRQQIAAHLDDNGSRLERIGSAAQALTGEAKTHALARVRLLRKWEKMGTELLPFLLKMLGDR